MIFTENKRRILAMLNKNGPMSVQRFHYGNSMTLAQSSMYAIGKWLDELYAHRCVDIVDDKYVITYEGKVRLLGSVQKDTKEALRRDDYKVGDGDIPVVYRPGAFDFLKCKSFGVRC
jgi:hypothetical protein